jgi:hypothetical protein
MKRIVLFFAVISALGLTATAQDDSAFVGWMKSVGPTGGSLRKNIEAKNGDGAAADAKKLQATFVQVHEYFSKKGVDDAMKFAMTASATYGEVADLAAAGKFDDASASLKKASATCGGCHAAHREKAADGTYKIK